MVYTDAVTAADEYMFITGSDASVKPGFESLTIKGVLSDGTEVTATVNKLGSKKLSTYVKENQIPANATGEAELEKTVNEKIVTYTKTGEQYNITVKDNYKNGTGVESIDKIAKGSAKVGNGTANSKTIFVIGDKSDNYKVYTGISNVPTVENGTIKSYVKSGTVKVVFATKADTSDGDTNGVYILGKTASAVKSGDDTIYVVEAYVNGKYVAQLELENYDKKNDTITRGYYANVTTSGGNSVDFDKLDPKKVDAGSAVTDFGDGVISNGTHNALIYDEDTVAIVVDGTKEIKDGSIDEIVYVEDDTDASSKVVLVPGTGDDAGHADYVFIIR